MADISKIALPNGTTYNIKDSNALTDDLFNMTPIGVTYGGKYDPIVLDSDALPLVAHNRPILIDFGSGGYAHTAMYYYMNDAVPGSTYEGCKLYGCIDTSGSFNPDTESFIEYRLGISVSAIDPQNGNMYGVFYKDITNI